MSHLLITTLGTDLSGGPPAPVRYRLPGGDRIVETAHVGIDLAPIVGARRIHFVATHPAAFAGLLDLVPAEVAAAPVPEPPPRGRNAGEDDAGEPETSASPADAAAEAATGAAAEAADPEAAGETATEADAPAGPAEDQPAPPAALERRHEPDTRSLRERLLEIGATGRADKGALRALARALQDATRLEDVRCVLVSDPAEGRGFQSTLLSLCALPDDGMEVTFEVSQGARLFPTAATMAMWYFLNFRPAVRVGNIFQATEAPDASGARSLSPLESPFELMAWMEVFKDMKAGRAPRQLQAVLQHDQRLQRLAGPYVRFQRGIQFGALSEIQEGARLLEEKRRKLGKLPFTHPFRLFNRVMGESVASYAAEDAIPSALSMRLAREALQNGMLPLAALHLRETLLSHCIECYGRNPTRPWIEVPGSGGAQEVRPRDVAAYILSTEAATGRAPELAIVWPLLATARNRYVNTSPTTVPAGQLKDEDHEVHRLLDLCEKVLERNALAGIEEALPFDQGVKQAVDLRAVRPREGRASGPAGRRGRRARPQGVREEAGGPGAGGGGRPPRRERGPGRGGRNGDRRPPREEGAPAGADREDRDGRHGIRPPREDPADSTPRVRHAGRGLGNLGLALAQAGLTSKPASARDDRPSGGREGGRNSHSPAAQTRAQASEPPDDAPPAPGSVEAPPAPGSAPPPSEPAKAAGEREDFDVGGPV